MTNEMKKEILELLSSLLVGCQLCVNRSESLEQDAVDYNELVRNIREELLKLEGENEDVKRFETEQWKKLEEVIKKANGNN